MAAIDLEFVGTASADMSAYITSFRPHFYFAWVDSTDTTFGPEHYRNDENVYSFKMEHSEGDFASLEIEIENPQIGLLAPSRKVWVWLSYNNGTTVTPIFFGRLVGVPSDIQNKIVSLQFIARPADYVAQKAALAASLKVAPFYDPVWIEPESRDDPDVLLEARPELWHIDRTSHVVTTSNVLVGEDGTEEFEEGHAFFDSVKISLDNVPLRRVTVQATIKWTQQAKGWLSLSAFIIQNWPHLPDWQSNHFITTYTGEGLISSWPKAEQSIGGGWAVKYAQCKSVMGGAVQNVNALPPGTIKVPVLSALNLYTFYEQAILVPLWWLQPKLEVKYETARGRIETVEFTLESDMQAVVTMPGDDEALIVKLNSVDVGEAIDGVRPIGDLRSRSFLPSDRGRLALEHLIAIARSNLLIRARAVSIEFACEFERALELSCRKNVLLHDPRIPGGQALGKIVSYGFSCSGDSGSLVGSVKIGCAVGYGNSLTTQEGDGDYCETDYAEPNWQELNDEIVAIGAGDVTYVPPLDNPIDDGIDFIRGLRKPEDILLPVSGGGVSNGPITQAGAVDIAAHPSPGQAFDEGSIREALQAFPTTLKYRFRDLTGGPFTTPYNIVVSDLVIPQGIDLENEP